MLPFSKSDFAFTKTGSSCETATEEPFAEGDVWAHTVSVPMLTANRITSLIDAGIIAAFYFSDETKEPERMAPAANNGRADQKVILKNA